MIIVSQTGDFAHLINQYTLCVYHFDENGNIQSYILSTKSLRRFDSRFYLVRNTIFNFVSSGILGYSYND